MFWFGRDLKDHVSKTPCHGQKCPLQDQVAQSLIKLHLIGWIGARLKCCQTEIYNNFISADRIENQREPGQSD